MFKNRHCFQERKGGIMQNEIIEKFTVLITSAFGLVAALAWNEAIKEYLKTWGLQQHGVWVYAVIVTEFAVVITVVLGWIAQRAKTIEVEKYACMPLKKVNRYVNGKKTKKKKR